MAQSVMVEKYVGILRIAESIDTYYFMAFSMEMHALVHILGAGFVSGMRQG